MFDLRPNQVSEGRVYLLQCVATAATASTTVSKRNHDNKDFRRFMISLIWRQNQDRHGFRCGSCSFHTIMAELEGESKQYESVERSIDEEDSFLV
jgi:hypothetical protein